MEGGGGRGRSKPKIYKYKGLQADVKIFPQQTFMTLFRTLDGCPTRERGRVPDRAGGGGWVERTRRQKEGEGEGED